MHSDKKGPSYGCLGSSIADGYDLIPRYCLVYMFLLPTI